MDTGSNLTAQPGSPGVQTGQPSDQNDSFALTPPTVQLPRGGGAIRGMGEKFAANPVTGTGSMSIPFASSPGRSGFGPQLALAYDSGAGNGPFGFGWSLSLPSITRKTDKGLPKYQDAGEEDSDIFILSGSEDLVPEFEKGATGNWLITEGKHRLHQKPRTVDGVVYQVRRYRPRSEGLFASIERWTNTADPGDVHWRSISRDNILTLYGKDHNSRIADAEDRSRIFTWLICETRDDRGNAILYHYKAEDGASVDLTQAHERNRGNLDDPRRTTNRYLKHIRYGNRVPLLDSAGQRPPFLTDAQIRDAGWMFAVVFDYDEHDPATPTPDETGQWTYREDPFSTYRAGFEVRTTRLCQRVLMFHHFPDEEGVGNDCLVRSTDFTYSHEQDPEHTRNPIYTFLLSVTQSGYKRDRGGYLKRSLPPVEFEYTQPIVQDIVEEVDAASLENLPIGLDGATYQWTDLHGEGLPGILTEQGGGWYYKRNLSPINEKRHNGAPQIEVRFAPVEQVAAKPNLALAGGAQFMDLAGDGRPDLVVMDGPMPGLYEHDGAEGWQPFRPFTDRLNRVMNDPNLRFVDLDGDGHADVLITENGAFVWHASLSEAGFGPAHRVAQALDEEKGPRLVFADGTQSIYLADLNGDGLTDLARIRSGEVCYWPNLGYARFGAKVTMDHAPHFDRQDQFDHRRIRLADIDGSGTTDIIYLHRDGVRLYFNQSGNSWSEPQVLSVFPRVDDVVSIQPVDLLGNGTACLVWSSPLPGDATRPMRYVNLMGNHKPHLLVKMVNNLGAETRVEYAPSTKFYLQDKRDGKPWVTRLPFPVHVVEKVIVTDKWRKTRFATTSSYHHGYFDGVEREFRGFGRVEQVDVESYGEFAAGNRESPFITDDQTLYQPPVKTVTWYHTGVALDRERILSHYETEYFPNWFERQNPDQTNLLGDFLENVLPEPDLQPGELSAAEWREAMRACKGMPLRQEVYELDVESLEQGEQKPVKLFSAAYHNCHIRRLQPQAENLHAVFLVTESEAISYAYELDLRRETLTPDQRIAHTLNLNVDEFGNVLQAVAAAYPRLGQHQDPTLPPGAEALIARVQTDTHLAYSETRYTNNVDDPSDPDSYRLGVPCEVLTYELSGIGPEDADGLLSPDRRDDLYFIRSELRRFRLSPVHQAAGDPVPEISYHQLPNGTAPEKRLVEHVRMLFFKDDFADPGALKAPLAFGHLGRLGLPYETYKLALTETLLNAIFADDDGNKLDRPVQGTTTARQLLGDAHDSGYLSGADLAARFAPLTVAELAGQYWIRSGIAGFADDAAEHFFLPEKYIDPFNNTTTLNYDLRDLFIKSSTDPVGNTVSVERFDYRVLAPLEIDDINDNRSEVIFDVLGMPAAMAVKGKSNQADNLSDVLVDLDLDRRFAFFTQAYSETEAQALLSNASARHVYDFGEERAADGTITYGHRPASAAAIMRERHVARLVIAPDGTRETSRLQVAFECSDGGGNVLVTKTQAEPETPGSPLRWIASGKTILNNKGKPVKQYEPYFTASHTCADPIEVGVTPIMYYDAAGRLIRTELPDGSFSRVEFSPWWVAAYDPNDTARDSTWYADRLPPNPEQPLPLDLMGALLVTPQQRAAWLAALHYDTPSVTILDTLGREVIGIAHNRVVDNAGPVLHGGQRYRNEKTLTFTRLDAEGKPLWIRDARGNLVMQYITPPVPNNQDADPIGGFAPCYDIAGNLLFQHSMDGGDRWMITDAAGQPFVACDGNERVESGTGAVLFENRVFHATYDTLRRPLEQRLRINEGPVQVIERFVYGEGHPEAKERNLRGQGFQHYDASGLITMQRFDFKGNLLEVTRQLASAYDAPVIHWPPAPTPDSLEENYTQKTEYDALARMVRQENWHIAGRDPAIYIPQYNERGLLASETLTVGGQETEAILNIEHDAKGQRTRIQYGNGTTTRYTYDRQTFRLAQLRTTKTSPGNSLPTAPSNLDDFNALQNLYYTYDPIGNTTDILDDAYEPVFFDNQQVTPRSFYRYDSLYRLIEASGRENISAPPNAPRASKLPEVTRKEFAITERALRNYAQHYSYDSVGNIEQMQHVAGATGSWTRHYEYAVDSNRLIKTWQGSVDTNAIVYQYDTHGSMLNLNNTADEFKLHWDYNDMIHHVNLGGGGQALYNYGADKERTRKRIERNCSSVEERLYLGGMERYRRWVNNNLVEEIETHHLFDGEQRVLIVEDVLSTDNVNLGVGTLFRYQYSNHLDSVGLEVNGGGSIISYEEYHPYGTTAYSANNSLMKTTKKRYRYTGMERDEESGLSYHSARYYLPWLWRWGSVDPAGLVDGGNLYEYASNNPIIFVDLDGRDTIRSTGTASHPVGSWSYWVKKYQKMYPELEGHASISGTPEKGVMTRFGIRVPSIEGNTLLPREGYVSKTAALMAYQGWVHYAELIESGRPKTAREMTNEYRSKSGTMALAPPDNELDLATFTKWTYRGENVRNGVLLFALLGGVIRAGGGATALATEEAAAARATATQSNVLGTADVTRTITSATGKETFVHTTARANLPFTAESAAANIERTQSINLSSGGAVGQWGEGVYAYEGSIGSMTGTLPKVQFNVPAGTAIERIVVPGQTAIVRLIPAEGSTLSVVNPTTNLTPAQLEKATEWLNLLGL